jgi:transposase-like protein
MTETPDQPEMREGGDRRTVMKLESFGPNGVSEEAERRGGSRSEPSRSGASSPGTAIADPEVVEKATRRRFTAAYKLRILQEIDSCSEPGAVGRILRREGLYSSLLTTWRKARREGALKSLEKKRGRKPLERNPLAKKVERLERENDRLRLKLEKAETILEVQRKVAGLLGFSLTDGKDC